MIITGYKMDTTDLKDVTVQLDKIKNNIKKKVKKKYNELLGEEIAFICDNISLGVMNRNPQMVIFDEARICLERKINNAKIINAENKYNFTIYAHIMTYEENTYLKVTCPNKDYLSAFSKLEDFSLDEIECMDKMNHKTVVWNKIHELYSRSVPLVVDFAGVLEFDKDNIVYPEKKDRAETRARHTLTSQYLNMISGGQQIPPALLMPYFDIALEMLEHPNAKTEYRNKVTNLMQILIDLNVDDSFVYKRLENDETGEDSIG